MHASNAKPTEGRTADGKHIDYGTGDSIPMPDRFSAPDNGATISGIGGHVCYDDYDMNDMDD